jgi:hypothetical protein
LATDLKHHQFFVVPAMTKDQYDEFERVNGKPYSTLPNGPTRRRGRVLAGTGEVISPEHITLLS